MSATKAIALLALVALFAVATASEASSSVEMDNTGRSLQTFGHYPLGIHKLHYFPRLYNHFHKIKVFKDCHDDDCEDDYHCDDECEDEEHDDCKYKYVRKCFYKHNHKECDCKEDKKKFYVVIKKKDHCDH